MLRAENCICGTSSTGTGTLTLAACPAPPGGTDLFQAFNVQALGTGVAIPISYTIVEYTGSNFQTASQQEKGIGSLTLGASVTATALARTTVQQTAIGMSTPTPTYNTAQPTAISIATAANTLVFIAASAAELVPCSPYFDMTLAASEGWGALPVNAGGAYTGNFSLSNNSDHYTLFEWRVPMLAKRLRVRVQVVGSEDFENQALYGRLYAVGANARPTKLLYNFGTFVGDHIYRTTGIRATSATGSGFYMGAGEYFLDLAAFWTMPGTPTPTLAGFPNIYNTGRLGYGLGGTATWLKATSASTISGDPANVTSLNIGGTTQVFFGIATT